MGRRSRLIAVALGVGVAWQIARRIQISVDRAVRIAKKIAEGTLDNLIEVAGEGKIGRLLGAIQQRLRGLVADFRDAAVSIETAVTEVAGGNLDLIQRTEPAAERLQETANSLDNLSGNLRHAATAAEQANQLASNAPQVAQRSRTAVGKVVTTTREISASSIPGAGEMMTEIVASVEQVTNNVGEVTGVSASQSGGIHGTIHGIAELDHATQQNAALVVQGTAAAKSLQDQARRLTGLVSNFNLDSHPVLLSHNVGSRAAEQLPQMGNRPIQGIPRCRYNFAFGSDCLLSMNSSSQKPRSSTHP